MFKIATRPRLTRPVPLFVEVDGKKEDNSFIATFQIIEVDLSLPERLNDEAGQQGFLREIVVDLRDIEGPDGKAIPFGPDLLGAVINRFDARGALIKAYFEATREAAQGN